uniref:toll/interleukin-1 receptor domain-containing adapter protein n=1 Tax=Euleptes europaea TaxID=460621 RepID=UPI0025418142|nr:toll/interleukin-1 receptor domain-containing adapter protein [Euleptes europaea]
MSTMLRQNFQDAIRLKKVGYPWYTGRIAPNEVGERNNLYLQRKIGVDVSHLKLSPDMAGWFKWLPWKSRQSSSSSKSPPDHSSPSSPSPRLERDSNSLASSRVNSPKLTSCTFPVNISSSESARWNKLYDACICHSEGDLEFVEQMVSYLESQPERFRCFLQLRDAVPGGAIVSELCEAVQNSHCWVLLITSSFLKDPWCIYQMHQALMEAPMANGRIIPVLKGVDRRDYPRELKCIYYISITVQEEGFMQVKETVMRYLRELCKNACRNMD